MRATIQSLRRNPSLMRRLVNGTAAIWHRHVTRARQHRLASWSTGRIVAGPIASRPSAGLPPLSWLPSIAGKNIDQFVASLNTKLQRATQAGTSPAIETLMSRVLASDALHMRTRIIPLPSDLERDAIHPAILLIDERTHSAVDPDSRPTQRLRQFREMVSHACDLEHDASIWILRSNDPGSGPWLSSHVSLPDNTHILCANTSLRDLLRHVTRMYVVTASEGMGALLASVPLHVFGRPLYAGWGLTNDARSLPNRSARPTIAALFESLFVEHVRYLDPVTYDPGTLDVLLDFVEVQHSVARRFAGIDQLAGIRFQWWKRPFATPFLTAGGGRIRWTDGTHPARPGEFVAFWGARKADKLSRAPHLRIEDGFIHSAGLGSDMSPPRSQVVDRQGIYFDASAPSDLTDLLNHETFDDTELERAEALRHKIVSAGLTKYNLGRQAPTWRAPEGRTVVLVPGQVADDASIRLGTRSINSLDTLLRYVRERRPNAFIVYKPHPDVLSGNRNGLINAAQLANIVDSESDMISLIEAADEVHTLSSLAGFDALLRGKRVFTYGLPFYAGWGLTEDDLAPLPWRERTLSLDMLVAGALLRYPLYWDWQLKLFTTPEAVINQLSDAAARPLKTVARDHWRPYLKAFRWTRNALRHLSWRYQQNSAR